MKDKIDDLHKVCVIANCITEQDTIDKTDVFSIYLATEPRIYIGWVRAYKGNWLVNDTPQNSPLVGVTFTTSSNALLWLLSNKLKMELSLKLQLK